jgi:ribosome-associated protein YbcJ (S4-like RNA binding protein)
MKRLLALFGFTLISSIGIATLSDAAGSKLVEGDVLKIEGEFYTVHDTAGHEVRLHVDKTTHLEGGAFKAGDKVEAHVTEQGHARSMIHLTAAGKMETPGSKIVEGDVLKIEGEFYTVHDTAGHEVRLHVDKTTHLEGGAFKAGDKVEAYATDKGHARAMYHIKHLQPAP